jgi:hypothetical protein
MEGKMVTMSQTEYLVRQIVDRRFEESAARHGQICRCPIIDGTYVSGFDPIDVMKELAVRALLAREWFAWNRPPDAPTLPLCYSEREALKVGGLRHIVAWYARSLEGRGYNVEEHPSFYDYACGVMVSEQTLDFVKNDPELRKQFPPRPLKGLGPGLCWHPPEAAARVRPRRRAA